ncbi:MAG: sigma-70 family RNA polymerase sigma factor [Planctomycetota bacterium]
MVGNIESRADALLGSARNGNSNALGALFSLYQNYIKLLAATQIRPQLRLRASPSDVVQDTFLHAHRGFGEFRGTSAGEFVAWLRAILSRRLQYVYQQHLDAKRRDVRREVSFEAIANRLDQSTVRLENVLVDSARKPDSVVDGRERAVVIADALAELPNDYGRVLVLRCIDGLPFAEVAEQMNRSPGAARMLWLRAVESLRDKLRVKGQL